MLKAMAISAADGLSLLHAKVLKKTQPPSHRVVCIHTAESNRAVPRGRQELTRPADTKGQPAMRGKGKPVPRQTRSHFCPTGDKKPGGGKGLGKQRGMLLSERGWGQH